MFKYGDKVKAISGFFEGHEGYLTDIDYDQYYIHGFTASFNTWIDGKELEKIEEYSVK